MREYTSPDPFRQPVPLQSLTEDSGQWPWNRPPNYVDPIDFVEEVEKKLKNNKIAREDILDMLIIGATVEDVVNTIAIAAFSQGKINPDCAELAKIPLATVILDIAEEADIPVTVFSSSPKDEELEKDINKINLLRETNPEMLSAVEQGVKQEVQQQEVEEQNESFIKMEK